MSELYNAIVRFQYDPDPENASDDLQLSVNEVIKITEVVDDEWLFGSKRLNDGTIASGYFPKSFVERLQEGITKDKVAANDIVVASTDEDDEVEHETSDTKNNASEQKPYDGNDVHEPLEISHNALNVPETQPDSEIQDVSDTQGISHDSGNFKNKIQSFNVSSTPVMPLEKLQEDTFVKKSFGGIDHRSSYIPPSLGKPNMSKKEERKSDAIGEVVKAGSPTEEPEAPQMTLKERMMILKQKQEEEQEALLAAMKRKEEKKKGKQSLSTEDNHHHHKSHESILQTNEPDENITNIVSEDQAEESSPVKHSHEHESIGDYENSDLENDNHTEMLGDENTEKLEDLNDEDESGDDEDEDEDEDEDDEDDEEEDEEEIRKRELAQRMAKLSGGMGMMGMMGMMPPSITKKTKKTTKKAVKNASPEEGETVDQKYANPIPILPMMGIPTPLIPQHTPNSPRDTISDSSLDEKIVTKPIKTDDALPISDQKDDSEDQQVSDLTSDHNNVESSDEVCDGEDNEVNVSEHPYRVNATPTNHHRTPPLPPMSSTTSFSGGTGASKSDIPAIPMNLPPSMPQTTSYEERPPMPPPPPPPTTTTAEPHIPQVVLTAPAPIPGHLPAVVVPTQMAPSIPPPIPSAIPSIPGAAPPIPTMPIATTFDDISRKSSVSSRPPAFHAPPLPPTPPQPAPAATSSAIPPMIDRQLTRTSLDSSISNTILPASIAPNSNNTQLWWTTGSLPPQISASESSFEVDTSEIKLRNGDIVKYMTYYILDVHLACITLELAYHLSEPERLLFFHESKEKNKSSTQQLVEEYAKFGPSAYNAAVKLLNLRLEGKMIDAIFDALPESALKPVANKTFGAVVYRNNNGDSKFYDEIRPGDVLVLVKASFDSSSGPQSIGFEKPHVSIVTSYESDNNKIKVIEEKNDITHQARFKLSKMKSGKLRVFRIVGRGYVGW